MREALAPEEIGCEDFAWEAPPTAIACSFSEWVPQRGFRSGTVVMYADEADAALAVQRCKEAGEDGGQILHRDGQAWLGSIVAHGADRVAASDVDDQVFVARFAELLGTDVIDC